MQIKYRQIRSFVLAMVLLLSTVSVSCATTSSEMERQLAKGYPESEYLTAIGVGQSEPEARNRALAELGRIFESKVSSDALDRMKSVLSGGNESFEQTIESQVRVASEVDLKGVEIGKVIQEKSNYYALAVLERAKAGGLWKREIEDLDAKISGQFKGAEDQKSLLIRYKALKAAAALWVEREVVVSRLKVLGYAPPPTEYDMKAAFAEMPQIKARMHVHVEIVSQKTNTLAKEVAEALGAAGFIVTPRKAEAEVLVSGELAVTPVEIDNPEGWKYARAEVAVTIADAATGLSVGEVSENVRASHLSASEAAKKAVSKIAPTVAERIVETIEN